MKKLIVILSVLLLFPIVGMAQKYACVNTEYILSKVPDYASAQAQLNKLSEAWQREVEAKFQEIDRMYKAYQQEAYLLPDNLKRKREEEIIAKENEARALQNRYFGAGGELDKKREELMKPIQDRIYNTIERIANEKGYAFIFDKSGSATVLFASAKYDISDQVLDLMGLKPDANPAPANNGGDNPAPRRDVTNPEMRRPGK